MTESESVKIFCEMIIQYYHLIDTGRHGFIFVGKKMNKAIIMGILSLSDNGLRNTGQEKIEERSDLEWGIGMLCGLEI